MEGIEILKKEEFESFLRKEIKKVIFIGGSDTGKTTLIKNIANFLFQNKEEVFIFDCDIGQSHIGPPTTIGYAKLKERIGDDFYLNPDKFYFVGSVTPSLAIVEFLTGVFKIFQYLNNKKGKILVDTTGYIRDKLAISFKINKILILKPDLVILLERENELDEIVEFLKFTPVEYKRIKIKDIPFKSAEDRANYRKKRFIQYFQNFKEIDIDINKISVRILNFKTNFLDILKMDLKNFLCSLKNEFFEDISLGIVKKNEREKLKILIPEKTKIEKIKGITISNFLMDAEIL